MSRLLLVTDSNFINNVGDYNGRKIKNLEVKSCQSRRLALAAINEPEEGLVVVACLDMIAADIAKSTSNVSEVDRIIEMSFDQLFHDLTEKAEEASDKLAYGVIAPLFWTSHSKEAKHAMSHAYKLKKDSTMKNVWCTDFLREVRAGVDGTHLTSTSANKYIEFVYNFIIKINGESGCGVLEFEEPTAGTTTAPTRWEDEVDSEAVVILGPPDNSVPPPSRSDTMLSMSMLSMDNVQPQVINPQPRHVATQSRLMQMSGSFPDLSVPPPTGSLQFPGVGVSGTQQPLSLVSLDQRLGSLEEKSFYDNLTMAALKEDLDTEANKAMLNRISLSGVEIPNLWKMDEQEKIRAMKAKMTEIIEVLKDEGQNFEIQFVRHLNRQVRGAKYAVIEVKFPDPKQAKDLRAHFVQKRKSLPEKVNITPVVRLATRVRVEIMHSIAALVKRMDPTVERAMCLQYAPKPVIKITRKTAGGVDVTKTMSFTESITWVKVNGLKDRIDLSKAHERAGASFRGTLAQNFVLLN